MISQDLCNFRSPLPRVKSKAKNPVIILIEDEDQDSTQLSPQSNGSYSMTRKSPLANRQSSSKNNLYNCSTRSISRDLSILLEGKTSLMPLNKHKCSNYHQKEENSDEIIKDQSQQNILRLEPKNKKIFEDQDLNKFRQFNINNNIQLENSVLLRKMPSEKKQKQQIQTFEQFLKRLYRQYQLQKESKQPKKQEKKKTKRHKKQLKRLLQLQDNDELQTSDDNQLIELGSYRYKIPSIVSMIQELSQQVKNDKLKNYTNTINFISQKPTFNMNSKKSTLFINYLKNSLKKRRYIDVD